MCYTAYAESNQMTEPKRDDADTLRIPLAEETVEAHVTERQLGVVRLTKRVETHPMVADVDLTTDEVHVQRRTRNEVVTEAREPWHEGDTLVIPLYEERVITEKQLVLIEEVRVRNRPKVERAHIQDSVRKEVLDVETIRNEP